jgi:hypothetical protein
VTLRHDSTSASGFTNDAASLSLIPGIGDTVLTNSFTATIGDNAEFFNMPVTAFQFGSAVPEPASWSLLAGGLVLLAWRFRRTV